METVETRVLKSSFSEIKSAKKEQKLLGKSSTSYLGPGCREFESRHSDQKSRLRICGVWAFLFVWSKPRKIECNANERYRRRLGRGESLSAPFAQMQMTLATWTRLSIHSGFAMPTFCFDPLSILVPEKKAATVRIDAHSEQSVKCTKQMWNYA